jgi:hypothetical protein
VILVYAVVPADEAPGKEGLGVSVLAEAGVGLVYREVESSPTADRDEVLRFGRVVSTLAEHTAVLPVRFGTVLQGVEQARELLKARAVGWKDQLEQVTGHVELIVHARADVPSGPPPERPVTGGDYLRAKVSEHRRQSAEVADVAEVVTPWCRAARPLSSSGEVRLACLVAADDVADLRAAVDGWAAEHAERQVTVTGPFPVFSFTEDDLT